MKEWIKRLFLNLVIFCFIFIVLYNVVNIGIPNHPEIIPTTANRAISIACLSFIGWSALFEIRMFFKYLNNTVNKETFKSNIIKFTVITVVLMILSIFAFVMYQAIFAMNYDYILY